ncbi:MAG TPA: hypothetical protein VF679_07980, partial [Pedobacter sp.]
LAHLALHYNQLPTELDQEQVLDYLHLVKATGSPSATFFKFTVYGIRYACKLRGLPYQQFSLPSIERNDKLPVVLHAEVRALLKVCDLLKHRLLIGLADGWGLGCAEVRQPRLADVHIERGMVHVHQGKGNKYRCLPVGSMLQRGIAS